ncbi:hypothetical protein BIV57_19120 [Mangrovactinospora gilvigrisea]|uniref:Uncharacterized protein n=1 Tax=Mangrovactinospora gilvigrisea TaxID=1428644 RepID=A0A1J7BBC9_9ACTN|nr:hypothetical protein [Mangrovactinospora gilvigrisea]OIV35909.1 hypothetical protein BIV57_19120 [Mangrovactinospora gilvigrisea]
MSASEFPEEHPGPARAPREWPSPVQPFRLERLAEQHCGVVSLVQLLAAGVPPEAVRARCVSGGPWRQLLPGVVLLGCREPTDDQHSWAALRFAGGDCPGSPDPMLTGLSALARYGVGDARQRRWPGGPVDILVPAARPVPDDAGVRVHRAARLPRPVVLDGLPCAPALRAALDAASVPECRYGAALVRATAASRWCTPRDVVEELHTAAPAVRPALLAAVADDARRMLRAAGVPDPGWEAELRLDGRELAVASAYWEGRGVVLWIGSAADRGARSLAGAGLAVCAAGPGRLAEEPYRVVRDVLRALRDGPHGPYDRVEIRLRC